VGVRGNDLYSGGEIKIYNRDPKHRGVVLHIKEEHAAFAEQALCLSADEVLVLVEALLEALKEDIHHTPD
jgi:hypothetical protein